MEGKNQNQREKHREELKSRYSEPFNDSPFQYNQNEISQQNSRYDKSPSSPSSGRFPESPANRDQRAMPGGDRPPVANDSRIQEIISDRLNDDPGVDDRDIKVIVRHGEVTLAGTVDSTESKARAERLVDSTPGITRVDSRLRVRPGEEENESERRVK